MLTITAQIAPSAAFGTLLKGDTLFGQLCWAVRNHFGEARLRTLLDGYTADHPFAVVSDAFPAGCLPRPTLPGHWFVEIPGADRKEVKRRTWLPEQYLSEPIESWLTHYRKPADVLGGVPLARPQPHNVIDRRAGTTGDGFAPYAMTQHWYGTWDDNCKVYTKASLNIHVVLNEERLSEGELNELFVSIGQFGFGRDASIGLGKFCVKSLKETRLPSQPDANAWLTLSPCAPQELGLDPTRSFYQTFTRFGRHGDVAVHTGRPFKSPVLLAQTGAVLTPHNYQERSFIGSGLGGNGTLSKAIPDTVHQGYAPVVAIRLPDRKEAAP